MDNPVTDNPRAGRYEMQVAGRTAFITYHREAQVVTLLHAEVPQELSGQGIGSALARGTLELARAQGYKVVARCSFVASYINAHAEFHDLLVAAP